ncbi:MAG: phosphoribosylanthranilate isomerase [Saccharofermentans sp.]|nr:phosphoribosylanthranilate isomerase [Saccharofermentans sp.]
MIVKFCGLRREEDIKSVNATGPDLVGFILVKGRRRYIEPEVIRSLRVGLDKDIKVVGVFIDEDINVVKSLIEDKTIDIAQLHGSESNEYIKELKASTGATIIKAIGIRSPEDIKRAEESCADLIIVDSPGGGTGSPFDWELLKKIKREYILAGGINVDNLPEAMLKLNPYGFDISSGIETDGLKDEEKMKAVMAIIKKG